MSILEVGEIEAGIVAFLDPTVLTDDGRVCHAQDPPVTRQGPFVCLCTGAGSSAWTPLTTEWRRERVMVRREWRSGGHPQWLRDDQYVNDGANIWRGPNEAFVHASSLEVTDQTNRARVSEAGLA